MQIDNRDATMGRYSMLPIKRGVARLIVLAGIRVTGARQRHSRLLAKPAAPRRARMRGLRDRPRHYEPAPVGIFNGLLVLNEDGDSWYYKRHLVRSERYFRSGSYGRGCAS